MTVTIAFLAVHHLLFAQASTSVPPSDGGLVWYLASAAAASLLGAGAAILKLGKNAGNFLAPLILKVTDAHVTFLHKIEATAENQVEATKTLAGCVDAMRTESSAKMTLIEEIHKRLNDSGK